MPYSGNPKVKSPFRCPYVVTPFGVAGRGKASHWPFLTLGTLRYDMTLFRLGPFNINKGPFRCPRVVTLFGVAGRGKDSREIACIGHSVLLEP